MCKSLRLIFWIQFILRNLKYKAMTKAFALPQRRAFAILQPGFYQLAFPPFSSFAAGAAPYAPEPVSFPPVVVIASNRRSIFGLDIFVIMRSIDNGIDVFFRAEQAPCDVSMLHHPLMRAIQVYFNACVETLCNFKGLFDIRS